MIKIVALIVSKLNLIIYIFGIFAYKIIYKLFIVEH